MRSILALTLGFINANIKIRATHILHNRSNVAGLTGFRCIFL